MQAPRLPLLQPRRLVAGHEQLPLVLSPHTLHITISADRVPGVATAEETPCTQGLLHQRA